MDTVEKFSLLTLVLAYMIIVMLIVVYEITECHFSIYNKYFILEIILYISSNITNNLVSLLPPRSLISLS